MKMTNMTDVTVIAIFYHRIIFIAVIAMTGFILYTNGIGRSKLVLLSDWNFSLNNLHHPH